MSAQGVLRVLPTPTPIRDSSGRQWAAYSLEDAKKLIVLDDELYSLRLQKEIWGEARQGFEGQVTLLREILAKEQEKYDLLNARFLEKSTQLDLTIEEKNRLKYRRNWALFGGRSTLLTAVATLGLGFALAK